MPDTEHNPELVTIILDEIRARGPMTLARFMELALYHPEHGYYTAGRRVFGRQGDYFTSTDLHPAFGQALARQLEQMWRVLGAPAEFTVVEMGAGRGFLCLDILQHCAAAFPEFFEALAYIIDEQSPALRHEQQQRLDAAGLSNKVAWRRLHDMDPGVTGVFLSNELVDAFPVRQVVMTEAGLRETCVAGQGGELMITQEAVADSQLAAYLSDFGVELIPGQAAEINLAARAWLRTVSACLERGFVLTIDYGDTAERLYSPARAQGTLLCFHGHTASDNPLENIGKQDITAHVNFSDLIRTGRTLCLSCAGPIRQMMFLMHLGIQDLAAQHAQGLTSQQLLKHNFGIKNLISPDALGNHRVLIQYKGFDETPPLMGMGGK